MCTQPITENLGNWCSRASVPSDKLCCKGLGRQPMEYPTMFEHDASIPEAAPEISSALRTGTRRRNANAAAHPSKPTSPTAISLFSGGGGLDIGVEQAGFRTLFCVEVDPHACETLKRNQPKYLGAATVLNTDVRSVSPKSMMKSAGMVVGDLDLLYGGPPCQTFSQIGKQDSLGDDRGMLLFEMVRFAKCFRPKVVLVENVKALSSAKDLRGVKGGVLSSLLTDFKKLGYRTYTKVLNAADYGVAQLRERLFIVAVRPGLSFEFPVPSHGDEASNKRTTIRQALKGLRKPAGRDRRDAKNNHVDVTPEGDKHRISYVSEGSYLAAADAPQDIKGRLTRKDTTKFLRLAFNGQSKTLRCGEIFFHPTENRYLTPREYMRIHGYPNDYFLKGPIRGRSGSVRYLDQHRQVANSVPPPVAKAVASNVLAALAGSMPNG